MPDPVVIDTHVFNRLVTDESEFRAVYTTLIGRCDRVLITEQILDEYIRMAPRAGILPELILGQVIPELKRRGKWQVTGNRTVQVGPAQDRRFIGAALSGNARYIVSNDPDFETPSVRRVLTRWRIQVLSPDRYTNL